MQDQATIIRFLTSVPMFQSLNDRQLRNLARRFIERKYDKNDVIVTQGHIGVGLFVVMVGSAEAVKEQSDGTKTVVATFGPTDFFGELSLIDEAPRIASVIATSAADCLVLSRLDFLAVLEEDVEIPIMIMRELVSRLRKTMERIT
jgi:CRP/FNR family transcriptional regulator, cyclic AMP receptor protein